LALIETINLYYRYPTSDKWILRGINLRINRERVVVAGGTGSGKTTLLRVISGLAVRVYGGSMLGEVRVEGRTAYVPQNFDLYILMPTAREELAYILASQGLSVVEVEAEIRRLSDLLGIREVLDQSIMKLSMGQRQRVAIASALSLRPDILLLDEPFAHIDPRGALELVEILAGVDATIIIAEHKLRYIGDLVDRLVLLEDGVVSYDGLIGEIPTLSPDIEWPLKLILGDDC